jgi:uncharacterized protein (TIGR00255 family)
MTVRSMTGFARLRRASPEGDVVLSVKTLNHRGLDIHFYMPVELDPFEATLRLAVKKRVARGHVDLRLSLIRDRNASASLLNTALLDAYVSAFRRASADYQLSGAPDLNIAFRLPGMFGQSADPDPSPEMERFLLQLLDDTLTELNRFREREGSEIVAIILQRSAAIRAAAEEISGIRSNALPAFQDRLRQRLSDLLGAAQIEPQRIVQEAAVLADRSDIGEELDRLRIHSTELDGILAAGGELGKKLDFLLQEMSRETNTVLSKTGGIGDLGISITGLALAAKSDIEKIRELSLNLE